MRRARTLVTGFPSSFLARRVVQKLLATQPSGLITCVVQAKFEALKRKLAEEGLFEAERKRELPAFPRVIGIVTVVLVWAETPQRFHTRNPFASGGVYEDPATGAGPAALTRKPLNSSIMKKTPKRL